MTVRRTPGRVLRLLFVALLLLTPTALCSGVANAAPLPPPVIVTPHTFRFPANALNYDPGSVIIKPAGGAYWSGLEWQANFAELAMLYLHRPADWDGESSVVLRLYFIPRTSNSGKVDFFIRPRSYAVGDYHGDAASLGGTAVAVSGVNIVYRQSFTIPAATIGSNPLWAIAIQRGGSEETYADDVVLLSVEVSYVPSSSSFSAQQIAPTGGTSLPANALNYNKASGVITPFSGITMAGLLWKNTYSSTAFWYLARPADWDGKSDVVLRLYYAPSAAGSGNINFFIRPRAYDVGDTYGDVMDILGTPVAASGKDVVRAQSIAIPAATFGSKSLWAISIQRNPDTYTGDVVMLAVALSYNHKNAPTGGVSFPANAINYNPASSVITQYSGNAMAALQWKNDYTTAAFVYLAAPPGWDKVSDVRLHLYFVPNTSLRSSVKFFIRPRGYDIGEYHGDVADMPTRSVAVGGDRVVREQVFTIPAEVFAGKTLWAISIQRATDAAFTGDVYVLAVQVELVYRTQMPFTKK